MKKNEKYFKIVFMCMAILPLLVIYHKYDYDYYFYFDQGRYLIENNFKFPTSAYFVAYDGKFDFTLQRWLSSIIFYLIYKYTGFIGMQIFLWVISLIIEILLYKLLNYINPNKMFCIFITSIVMLKIVIDFISIRPYIFMFIVLLLELLILEKYIKENNKKILYFLPLIAFLYMQLYSSFYIIFFIFLLPYIFDFEILLEEKKVNITPYKKSPILIVTVISFLACIINPYGIKTLSYFLSTTLSLSKQSNEYLKDVQSEMLESNIHNNIFPYLIIFALFIIFLFKKINKINTRYYFLMFGTLILVCLQIRNLSIFFISTSIFIAYILDFDIEKLLTINKRFNFFIYIMLLVVPIMTSVGYYKGQKEYYDRSLTSIDWITENYNEGNTIFTEFNNPDYAIYKKQKVYMDTRSEIYFKNLNHTKDYFVDHSKIYEDSYEYNAFIMKYQPDFLIICIPIQNNQTKEEFEYSIKEYNKHLNIINESNLYENVYETEYYIIYKKNSK